MAATGAFAQSSVELFGIVDVAVAGVKVNNGPKNTGLSNSGESASRLGFRGTEDLGGGLKAGFWLETALANDSDATNINFARRSTLSLMGNFGELRLGRDYTPTFWNDTKFDPFGTVGVGTSVISSARGMSDSFIPTGSTTPSGAAFNPTYVRASNSVGYHFPANNMGLYGQLMYAFGENAQASGASSNNNNRYVGGRLGYAQGPLDVAVAYGKRNGPAVLTGDMTSAGLAADIKSANVGISYDFGMVKAMAEYAEDKIQANADSGKIRGYLLGAVIPVGMGKFKASYGQVKLGSGGDDGKSQKLALGYVHDLSKRTALYATYAELRNKNGADLAVSASGLSLASGGVNPGVENQKSRGYELGIRHSF